MKRLTTMLVLSCSLFGCSFYARGPDDYRTAVRAVLMQKQPEVQACYKRAYDLDNAAQGRVTTKFQVEAKTGNLVRPELVTAGTTAPLPLQQCVLGTLANLTLLPPDQRMGDATFSWDFAR